MASSSSLSLSSIFSSSTANHQEEGTKSMGLYLAVMNRIAERLSVVFPTSSTTIASPNNTTMTTAPFEEEEEEEDTLDRTLPEFSPHDDDDDDDDDDDFVSSSSSRLRNTQAASRWKVEMRRGSNYYAPHVLPESYRLQYEPVMVISLEPQILTLQLQGIPSRYLRQSATSSSSDKLDYHHRSSHHHHVNFQPLILEFQARFPPSAP
jgi:hypothetical protein